MLVKMGIFPKVRDENKQSLKPPPRLANVRVLESVEISLFWDEWSRSSLPKLPFVARVSYDSPREMDVSQNTLGAML